MTGRSSKPIAQPQRRAFLARVRERFANLGAIGKLSLSLSSAFLLAVVTILLSASEDHWLRSLLWMASLPLLVLFVVAASTEFVHGLGWIESKAVVAVIHFAVVVSIIVMLWGYCSGRCA